MASNDREPQGDLKIVVLQRGWVVVGFYSEKQSFNGTRCRLEKTSSIRNWGTSKGLGELVKDGPRPNTKLDPCNGLVEFDILTMVLSITIEDISKWSALWSGR